MPLLPRTQLTAEQNTACVHLAHNPATLLYCKQGGGKTVTVLTTLTDLFDERLINRVLIVSSQKICRTVWAQEAAKWEHTEHLTFADLSGNWGVRTLQKSRTCQIVLVNYEKLQKFFAEYEKLDFDVLVIDETSKLKSHSGTNYKALRKYKKLFKRRIGMTGTPVSENFLGLYGQALLLDDGAALGSSYFDYQCRYFYPLDYEQRKWELKPNQAKLIMLRLRKLVYEIPDYRDELPRLTERTEECRMPDKAHDLYRQMLTDFVVDLSSGDTVTAVNSAVLRTKLHQITQGFLYGEDGDAVYVHDAKLDAFEQVRRESLEPTLVIYWFKEDLRRLEEAYPELESFDERDPDKTVKAWNAGTIPLLAIHPRSAAHGLNLARGGSRIIFYCQYWSRDLYEQVIARLYRRGQTEPVQVVLIICTNGLDQVLNARVKDKAEFEKVFNAYLKEFRRV